MTLESLEGNIQSSAAVLIKLAEDSCWNKISHNLTFIISDFNEFLGEKLVDRRTFREKVNGCKTPEPLANVINTLKNEYHDLYDINLYIFKALEKETVVEIQYYRKSNMKSTYFEKIKDNQPMLHAKITLPGYALEGDQFDINWESGGGVRHYWKSFIYEFRYKRMMRKLEK